MSVYSVFPYLHIKQICLCLRKQSVFFCIFLLTKMYIRPNKIMFNFSVTPSSAQNAATSIICHAEKGNNPFLI